MERDLIYDKRRKFTFHNNCLPKHLKLSSKLVVMIRRNKTADSWCSSGEDCFTDKTETKDVNLFTNGISSYFFCKNTNYPIQICRHLSPEQKTAEHLPLTT